MNHDSTSTDNLRFDLRAYERLAVLLPRLLAQETLAQLTDAIADAVEELIPCSAVLLFELREPDGALVPLVTRGLRRRDEHSPVVPAGESLEALAIASARPMLARRDAGLDAIVAIPLVVRGRAAGCLTIHRSGPERIFGDGELRLLARLADVAAITLDNAQIRAKLADLAQTDELTGLFNRRGFFDALERVLAQGLRDGGETSVLTLDVDNLKNINDRFGHAVGDEVLVSVADTLVGRARRGDIVGRLGGDEFAVILIGASGAAATAIRSELEEILGEIRVETPSGRLESSASIGIAATTRLQPLSARRLVARSDADMYVNKNARKLGRELASAERPSEGAGAGGVHR